MTHESVLAVVEKSAHTMGFYRIADGAEVARVALGHYPHEFAVSPDRRYFYVSEYGAQSSGSDAAGGNQVAVVDVAARAVVGRLSCGNFRRPHGIARDAAGDLYVLCESANRLLVRRGDAREFGAAYATGGDKGHMLAVMRDGARAFFMNINSCSVTTVDLRAGADATPQTVAEGAWPEGYCFSLDESRLYVGERGGSSIMVIDTAQLRQVGTIACRPTPLRMATDRRGRIICSHFGDDKSVSVIDPASGEEEAAFLPAAASVFAGLSEDGGRVALSLQDDTVAIYNSDSWALETTIATRAEPDVTAFLP